MKTKLYLALLASSLLAVAAVNGCSSDTGTGTATSTGTGGSEGPTSTSAGSTTSAAGTGGGMPMPPPPPIGAPIDRIGRPAINTALNHTFDVEPAKGTAKDSYNQKSDPTTWAAASSAEFAKNLAILDSLDTVCGNQILAGTTPVAGRYALLASALADDRVYMNMTSSACTTYLAVEANASGLVTNSDCGGRRLD